MDPITAAIVAALPALASDLIGSAVKDAYAGLKALIARRWGAASPVAKSIDDLEKNPKSMGQAAVLAEHFASVNATADAEIMQALGRLVDELAKAGVGAKAGVRITANISGGNVGVAGAQNVSIGSMNVGAGPEHKKS